MVENSGNKKPGKVKIFLKGLVEKLDNKMKEKANAQSCCCKPSDKGKSSCCS